PESAPMFDMPIGTIDSSGVPEFGWRRFIKPGALPNVCLGVSAERQTEADQRIPHLLATPAAVRFVSLEPLLGPIDLDYLQPDGAVGPFPEAKDRRFYGALSGHRGRYNVVRGGGRGADINPRYS